jgi:hypothetical protein
VFTKGSSYAIQLCSRGTNANDMIITLFDSKRNRLGSSKLDGELVRSISYTCYSTGIYYMQYSFENSTTYYGESVLSFSKTHADEEKGGPHQ